MNELVAVSESPEMELQSAQEMAFALAQMKQKLGLVQSFFRDVMIPNQDYGIIPGTDKPTLLKSGAEKLCELYGYAPKVAQVEEQTDMDTGFYRARVTVALVHRRTGTIVAEGVGEANTNEGRYRWRWIPEWDAPKELDKSTLPCKQRKDKKGRLYKVYRLENDDPWSLWNTVLKMAKKRALIDATLSATRSSGIFTQDMDDLQEWMGAAEEAPVEANQELDIAEPESAPVSQPTASRKPSPQRAPEPASPASTDLRAVLGEAFAIAASLKISKTAFTELLQDRYGKNKPGELSLQEAEDLRNYLADMQAVATENSKAQPEAGK